MEMIEVFSLFYIIYVLIQEIAVEMHCGTRYYNYYILNKSFLKCIFFCGKTFFFTSQKRRFYVSMYIFYWFFITEVIFCFSKCVARVIQKKQNVF